MASCSRGRKVRGSKVAGRREVAASSDQAGAV